MTTPHAATLPAASTAQDPHLRKTVIASVAGNAMEWYDFFVYGTAAALVFGKLFFPPGSDPLVGTLGAFAAFAIGFIARPFGYNFAFELRKRQQDVQRQASQRGCCVELLSNGDQIHIAFVE